MVSYILVPSELGFVKIEQFYLNIASFELLNLKGLNGPMEFKLQNICCMEIPWAKSAET